MQLDSTHDERPIAPLRTALPLTANNKRTVTEKIRVEPVKQE
jgi:hypothetical protein